MKRILSLVFLAFLMLSACAKVSETPSPIEEPKAQLRQQQPVSEPVSEPQPPTWEERYDLGLRYLSEGKYEEAIIAFTAAIEIDPKRAPAFVGRGDSYVELARPETGLTSYSSAEKDYQTALSLDDQVVEIYVKLSEVYLAIDEPLKAVEILQQGYEITGDESLKERIETLQEELSSGTFVGVPICNPETYQEQWNAYNAQYRLDGEDTYPVSIRSCGVRFPTPVKIIVEDLSGENMEVEISEATLCGSFEWEQITTENGQPGPLVGKMVEFTGYFTFEDRGELTPAEDDEQIKYTYNPNGPYNFYVETVRETEIDEVTEE